MSNAHFAHAVSSAFKQSKNMAPVGEGKNALVAFAMGFLFGPFGVGLYLKSFGDFAMTLTLVIGGSVLTAGVGAPVFWLLCGAWAYVRVQNSKRPAVIEPAASASSGATEDLKLRED